MVLLNHCIVDYEKTILAFQLGMEKTVPFALMITVICIVVEPKT